MLLNGALRVQRFAEVRPAARALKPFASRSKNWKPRSGLLRLDELEIAVKPINCQSQRCFCCCPDERPRPKVA
jgi:hypothetical protein